MHIYFNRWDIEVNLKIGERLKQRIEDAIALKIQTIIGHARARNIVHYDNFIDSLYGEDSLSKTLEHVVHQ